jgi:hypothetical protein
MQRTYPISRQKTPMWADILIVILGIAGAIAFFSFYERALPSASVDVTVSRSQAEQIATEHLNQLGYAPQDYKFVLSFSGASSPLYYLQRTLGVEEFNRRIDEEGWPLYYWTARWFKPLEKEEFRVYLMPDGDFLGMNHTIAEDATGADLPQGQASAIAESFLAKYAGWDPSNWEQVEAASEARPSGRADHTFEWKSRTFSAGEADLRYTVRVQGEQVGYVDYWIKVPESFSRQYASERDRAGFINGAAFFVGLMVFLVAALTAAAMSHPDKRRAILPALLAGAVTLAASLNLLPLYPMSYDTTQDYSLFWLMAAAGILFNALFYSMLIFILWAGGQSLSKLVWPRQDRILARGPERWLAFSRSAWRGLMFGGVQMGYVVLFYLFASEILGWWSPVTAEYSDLFATPFPFLQAFEVGLDAALTEELLFRLIGISLFLWLFRKRWTWLALLIPGVLWAFAHSSYVTYPIYARGVELTVVALFLGFVFLKFDLLTTIMSHFTYNMMVTGIYLLRSGDPYYQANGWIVVLTLALPLLPALFWTGRRLLGKERSLPDSMTLSPAVPHDVPQLAALPVNTDWPALLAQPNRTILCLRAGQELAGFATGFVDEQDIATLDGVYVQKKWRRQYWGATLQEALTEQLKEAGAYEIRALLKPKERQPAAFLHNLFWSTRAQVLVPKGAPSFGSLVKEGWQAFLDFLKKKEEQELQIPRDLLEEKLED